jgi:asparagine synthase (glutamine-hydrolysing)
MCGIAGLVSDGLVASGEAGAVVAEMLRRLKHRGPDGDGVRVVGNAALGAARLAVIDTRPVPQPVVTHDGRFTLAYNGEVYNHRAIRVDLEARGARFVTNTDTEVVAEAYRAWGSACLDRLVGMFAFVMHDASSGELFGARDRLGKKPLFIAEREGLFAFASHLPSLLAVPGIEATPDPEAILDVLEQGYVLGPKTCWRGIRQLMPGSAFRRSASGALETWRWWRLEDHFLAGRDLAPRDVATLGEQLDDLLGDAVEARLISDVPLGALLSGGIDSTTIAALMRERGDARPKTFTVAFDAPGFDESAHAAQAAMALGTEHHVDTCRLDDPAPLVEIQRRIGEPLADTSVLPTSLAFAAARRHVTVALTGDGADELFAGYETFRADRVLAILRALPAWPTRDVLRLMARRMPVDQGKVSLAYRARKFASGLELPDALAHQHWRALSGHVEALSLLIPEARAALGGYSSAGRVQEVDARVPGCDLVNRMSHLDMCTYLPDDILVKADRASMAQSVEARAPFLDHRVVELVARLPGRDKLRGWRTKWLLRRIEAPRLPAAVLARRKEGFSAPVARWLLGSMRALFFDLATADRCGRLGLDVRAVHGMHADLEARREFNGYRLWAVLVLCLWDDLTRERGPLVGAGGDSPQAAPQSRRSGDSPRP